MIKANELRVGNWLFLLKNDKTHLPHCIDGIDIGVAESSSETFDPIPLTPEILEKCGFKYGKTGDEGNHDPQDVVEYWDLKTPEHKHSFVRGFTFTVVKFYQGEFTFSHNMIRSDCKYVHQLQNLYFALTGEELEVVL